MTEAAEFIKSKESPSVAAIGAAADAVFAFNVLETRNSDLFAAFAWLFHDDSRGALRRALQKWLQTEDVFLTPSGECGIAQILSLLPQQEVVMPAWICHEVKTAARVAGKRIVYVDLGKNRINATSEEYAKVARPGQILLIAHLFGVPTDVQAICELAKSRDCVTVEDAVPAVGGQQDGRLLGTFADFGVFSFEKSKRLPAFRGGFIVANNNRLIERNKLEQFRVTNTSTVMPVLPLVRALAQNLGTNPWFYRFVTTKFLPLRPQLVRLLHTIKTRKLAQPSAYLSSYAEESQAVQRVPAPRTPFYTREIHPYQAELALRMVNRIDQMREKIARLAAVYRETFRGTTIATFLPPTCDTSGLMRFPVAFPGKDRSRILERARKQGIFLKVLWGEGEDLDGLPNSLWVSQNLVLLPLYTALSERSARALASAIVEIDRNTPVG